MAREKAQTRPQETCTVASAQPAGHWNSALPRSYLEALVGDLKTGVAIVSRSGEILYANRCFTQLLGATPLIPTEVRHLQRYVEAASWEPLAVALTKALREKVEGQMDIAADGQPRSARVSLFPLAWRRRQRRRVDVGIIADEVTELVKASQALRASEASIHSLSARILEVQDEAQRRIARDLHDITGQDLAALSLLISEQAHARDSADERKLGSAMQLIQKVQDDIRTLSYLLHPPLLDEMGLASALRWYVGGLRKRKILDVELDFPKEFPRLATPAETALFRVAQECLSNVYRHSGSRKAKLVLEFQSGEVRVSVLDRGKGMNLREESSERGGPSTGVGIAGMRERMKQLGGRLEINSGDEGTEVIASVLAAAIPEVRIDQLSDELRETASGGTVPAPMPGSLHGKRILIVDDHEVTRQGIKTLLAGQPDLEICGEAADGLDAVAKVDELQPDLVILDMLMPRAGGLTAAYKIHDRWPAVKILIFTTHQYAGLERMIRIAGCKGYVQKGNVSQDLICGVRAVLDGGEFFGSEVAQAHSA